ncbi:MAG TPA: hypothetical protein VGV87_14090 [Blastocatellia bacterium]|nr:hypothetical protein [Blastocatellia bacterium]
MESKHAEVVVKLKNRDSVRGYVGEVSRKSFVLQEKHGLMLIEYEEVASVKERNGLRRFLRGIADAAFIGVSYALWLSFQGIPIFLPGKVSPIAKTIQFLPGPRAASSISSSAACSGLL